MKKNERMALIVSEVLDLNDAVDAYAKAQKSSGCRYPTKSPISRYEALAGA